ncbi:hypothetical protein [Nocardia brasiliensis]|uniref:hypothetical protein n=1 Tax=Nocardia brasiliensis TaxID=37326 RepID=UPI001F324B13|nr:hypothetical protein [Nocardia brasiliensis]
MRRKRLLMFAGATVSLGLLAWLALRDTSPVGHFHLGRGPGSVLHRVRPGDA